MRFYLTTDGQLVGTQAEAGKGFEPVDVPTDKAGLRDFLNSQLSEWRKRFAPGAAGDADYRAALGLDLLPDVTPGQRLWSEMVATAKAAAIAGTVPVEIEEYIQSADPAILRVLTENCICRLRELLAELPA